MDELIIVAVMFLSGRLVCLSLGGELLFREDLPVVGLDLDKNAIQRIECAKRYVTDIELKAIAKTLEVSYQTLLDD